MYYAVKYNVLCSKVCNALCSNVCGMLCNRSCDAYYAVLYTPEHIPLKISNSKNNINSADKNARNTSNIVKKTHRQRPDEL